MCLLPKPKIPKVEAPSAPPPPPTETAESVRDAGGRPASDLAAKRRGLRSLMVDRAPSGVNTSGAASGLKL